jgi:hypothetical protein
MPTLIYNRANSILNFSVLYDVSDIDMKYVDILHINIDLIMSCIKHLIELKDNVDYAKASNLLTF